jgi:hypothetical protein
MLNSIALASLLALAATGASAASIETFDPAGSRNTVSTGIDRKGDVFGYWHDADFKQHGFVRKAGGTITSFDASGAVNTSASGADAGGSMTGDFYDGTRNHGYLRSKNGDITVFDRGSDTFSNATDAKGGTVGYAVDDGHAKGFLRRKNGTFSTIGVPQGTDNFPVGVTPDGMVAGWYSNATIGAAGFLRVSGSQYFTFHITGEDFTYFRGVNDSGTVAGELVTGDRGRGFIYDLQSGFLLFRVHGAKSTRVTAIGAGGAVVGNYRTADGAVHGYVRAPGGKITSFDVDGATQTLPQTINDKGEIAGAWYDADLVRHGFLRKP